MGLRSCRGPGLAFVGSRGPALAGIGLYWVEMVVTLVNDMHNKIKKKHTWGSRRVVSRAPPCCCCWSSLSVLAALVVVVVTWRRPRQLAVLELGGGGGNVASAHCSAVRAGCVGSGGGDVASAQTAGCNWNLAVVVVGPRWPSLTFIGLPWTSSAVCVLAALVEMAVVEVTWQSRTSVGIPVSH